MNKSDLLKVLEKKNRRFSAEDINSCVSSVLGFISDTLSNEDRLEIRGFGSFSVKRRERRMANNPSNQKKVIVEEKLFPVFRSSKGMKESINDHIT